MEIVWTAANLMRDTSAPTVRRNNNTRNREPLMFEPTLPQNDSKKSERSAELAKAQTIYQYAYAWPPGVATAATVPEKDGYTLEYIAHLLPVSWDLFSNTLGMTKYIIDHDGFERFFEEEKQHITSLSSNAIGDWYLNLSTRLAQRVAQIGVESLDVYNSLHQTLAAPEIQRTWDDDATFSWQRVAGVNPMVLRRVTTAPSDVAIFSAENPTGYGPTLAQLRQAMDEGRLYACDYRMFEGAKTGVTFNRQKWLPAPYALFIVHAGKLVPVAIQIESGPQGRVCYPGQGQAWQAARLAVQVADANDHETFQHLGRTHMVMEAVTLAMKRHIAEAHPLRKLFDPHTECTLPINHSAATNLIAPNGVVDQAFAGHIDTSAALVKQALETFDLRASVPKKALAARGVDDAALLPEYPYRDDALLVYGAIETFAASYIRLYYPSDTDVAQDYELQAFVKELGADDGGRIPGVGSVLTVADLTELLAVIVWTGSGQHAAVNFPQYPFMGAIPNMAGAFWSEWPPSNMDDPDLLIKLLPPYNLAMEQVYTVSQLSAVRINQLGRYGIAHFLHRAAADIADQFGSDLEAIETEIATRNRSRFMTYPYLLPSQIPQSIHI